MVFFINNYLVIFMVQNKDASFKFISKDHLKELFDILDFHLDFDIDPLDVEVFTD